MFLYGAKTQDNATFAPSFDSVTAAERDERAAAEELWNATRDLQLYRDNSDAEVNARAEAYERRNKAIFDATGVQLTNPYRATPEELEHTVLDRRFSGTRGFKDARDRAEQKWFYGVQRLARERPEHAAIIAPDRWIIEDAYAVTRDAERRFGEASANEHVGGLKRVGNMIGGGISGGLRDPLQIASLALGGGIAAPARTVSWRIVQTMLTEAAINGGVEAGLQTASDDYKKRAGVEHGVAPALQQVGLAALFGAGFGGLLQGGAEVFRLLGKAVPEEALSRAAAGAAEPGDVPAIAEALGVKLDPETARVAAIAAEQPALDRAAFGPAPAGIADHEAERLAADALRVAEDPPDALPSRLMQERAEAIDRIVKAQAPLGRKPRKPQSLLEFLSGAGGLKDDAGELATLDAGKWRRNGYRKLLQENGRSLDMARELAEEAGYIGTHGEAQSTTVADLLDAVEGELRGTPRYSAQDAALFEQHAAYDAGVRGREAYRQLVEEVDAALPALGIEHRLDDALLIRAAELVDDETDAATALERALDEDYRNHADALAERGDPGHDDSDIPFFDREDAGAVPRAGEPAGNARGEGERPGRSQDADDDGAELSRPGADEAEPPAPLRAAGDTPEPATPEADELAALTLTETRTAAGAEPLSISPPDDFPLDLWKDVKRQVANAMRTWASEKFGGKTVRNLVDGTDIIIPRSGIKHTTSRDSQSRRALAAMWRLDDMLTGARPTGSAPDKLARHRVVAVHYYERAVEIDGTASTMRIVVREDTTGRRYYDHYELLGGGPATGSTPTPDGAVPASGSTPRSEGAVIPTVQGPPDTNIGAKTPEAKDLWDAMPAATTADGKVVHATHETMIADADRSEFFGDLIASCKD